MFWRPQKIFALWTWRPVRMPVTVILEDLWWRKILRPDVGLLSDSSLEPGTSAEPMTTCPEFTLECENIWAILRIVARWNRSFVSINYCNWVSGCQWNCLINHKLRSRVVVWDRCTANYDIHRRLLIYQSRRTMVTNAFRCPLIDPLHNNLMMWTQSAWRMHQDCVRQVDDFRTANFRGYLRWSFLLAVHQKKEMS